MTSQLFLFRPKIGKYLPENIDPFLCTHIVFAFGWIKNGKLTSFEANDVSNSPDGKAGHYLVDVYASDVRY